MSEQNPWTDSEIWATWAEHEAACDRLGALLAEKSGAIELTEADARKLYEAALVGVHLARKVAVRTLDHEAKVKDSAG
jgi:hypothetical protein